MKTTKNELVFRLRLTPSNKTSPSAVWLEGSEQHAPIRFEDLQALTRYLRSLTDDGSTRGLR